MSSYDGNPRFVVAGPKGFLTFTDEASFSWGPEITAWACRTQERATMVLYELGLAQGESYSIREVNL